MKYSADDYTHALLLMQVISEAAKHGPQFKDIRDEAAAELNKMIADENEVEEPKVTNNKASTAATTVDAVRRA